MKILLSWLNDFIDLKDRTPEQIGADLESLGHEVETVEPIDSDALLTLAITANRGDCLSHLGIARELAAKWQTVLKPVPSDVKTDLTNQPKIQIDDPQGCSFYTARYLVNISHTPLPDQLRHRLKLAGHSQFAPIVELTNYVMEELGNPIHAFDADKVKEPIIIRAALSGETIELLDGKTYSLDREMIVVADATGPIALAGIMGGKTTAISQKTSRVILEAAVFDPRLIRKTRRKLKLNTDAAYRFERGVDQRQIQRASDRLARLVHDYLAARVGVRNDVGQMLADPQPISFNPDQINGYLGTKFDPGEMEAILMRLGFEKNQPGWQSPAWRHDINIWQDLAEEIARLTGYDQLPRRALPKKDFQPNPDDALWQQREQLKDRLASAGWTEHIGSSFLSLKDAQLLEPLGFDQEKLVKLTNPVSEEAAYLRPTQLVSLLKAIAKNPVFPELRFFELGTVFQSLDEATLVSLAWTGKASPKITGLVLSDQPRSVPQAVLQALKIRRPVQVIEIPVENLLSRLSKTERPAQKLSIPIKFREPSRYQPVLRDIAVLVKLSIEPAKVAAVLQSVPRVVDVELFDQYTGGSLPTGKQSLAFHLLLEDQNRTLTDEEIRETMEQVNSALTKQFDAAIR